MVDVVDLVTRYHETLGPDQWVAWRKDVLPYDMTNTELSVAVTELRRRRINIEMQEEHGFTFLIVGGGVLGCGTPVNHT